LYIDKLETEMYKEVVYNNPLLYDFVGEINNRQQQQEVRKQPIQCAVLSGLYLITAGSIGSLKDSQYLITDPINIFEKYPLYSDKSLEFPPIIHLGRAPYKNPYDSIMGFENIDYVVLKGLYSKDEDWRVLGNEMDLDQMESISCKPLGITVNSFRLAIIKNSDVKFQEDGDSTQALILRWWAVCQFKD
jgi:hypothetical protein